MALARLFYVGQEYLGSVPAPLETVHNEIHYPTGLAFFCPICAEVWARAVIEGEATQVRHRACDKHLCSTGYGHSSLGRIFASDIPGSLFLAESRAWNDALPARVIEREFRVMLTWAMCAEHLPKDVASCAQDMIQFISTHRRTA